MPDIYYGRGTKEQFDDYMDFINYVFGFNGNESDFKKLLPKLYKPELMPAYNSFNAIKDGKFMAAIGAYPGSLEVCGVKLKTCGIGNVAVHPYHRGEGYMKTCLNMAIDEMVKDGVDLSSLGGQRQRYNYFSYENAGVNYALGINKTNLRHAFGNKKTDVEAIAVTKDDYIYLNYIKDAYKKGNYVPYRDDERLFDVLCSWRAKPYIFKKDNEIIGYCVLNGENITEVYAERPEMIVDFVRALMEFNNNINIGLPPFKTEYLEPLEDISNGISITKGHMFTVLNYKNVVKAFMLLKNTYEALPDGEMKLLIHGRGGDEKLIIKVECGNITVENYEGDDYIELQHIEALRFIFSHCYFKRSKISPFAEKWFPLPIWEYSVDAV